MVDDRVRLPRRWRVLGVPHARTSARIGFDHIRPAVDDHSRIAYVEAHDDETKQTAAAVLRNAVAWFADRGVTVQRVLTDNGGCYRSFLWRDTLNCPGSDGGSQSWEG